MKPTLATAAASGTVGLALVVILTFILQQEAHITLPADVGTAIATLLAALTHWGATWRFWGWGAPASPSPVTPTKAP